MIYNELKQRGTQDFPIEYYYIDKTHPRYEMTAHWHSEIEIIRVLSGTLRVRLNNNEIIVHKGDIVFVNPETVHSATPEECIYECLVFCLDFLNAETNSCKFFIESVLHNEYRIIDFKLCYEDDFNIAVGNLFKAMKNKSSGYKFRTIGTLYELFGVIIDHHLYTPASGGSAVAPDKNICKLKNVLVFLRENYSKPLTLSEIAKSTNMSAKYFCQFFKSITGSTPIGYLNSYRIEKASHMLLNTDLSVTEIAFSCGFNDLSYFIKTFKATKGISPAKFRKR